MTYFNGRYRIASTRLQTWDYSQPGAYFVTICTQHRQPFFGQIVDHEMRLSPAGIIVTEEWQRTTELRSRIMLDGWIVMPNHLHGIICIDFDPESPDVIDHTIRWKPDILGSIINQFKGACTRRIRREVDQSFRWQSRFYEHIIRNDQSLEQIRAYIKDNPIQWEDDQLFIT